MKILIVLTASVAVRNQIIRGELCGNGPSNATTGSHLPLKLFFFLNCLAQGLTEYLVHIKCLLNGKVINYQ